MAMPNVLQEIVATKPAHIRALQARYPMPNTSQQSQKRSLYSALKQPGPRFIMECKRSSPSAGLMRDNFDLSAIVSVYNEYACAISVLTDEQYFKGSFDYLPIVRSLTDLPILCKDFVISAYQVQLAAQLGADAVLLMLSVLSDATYQELRSVAHRCGMDVLTEVSNEQELDRALALNATIVGINNRDLRTLEVDLNTTLHLAPRVPPISAVVSESGIHRREDVTQLQHYVDGFLVGSALMKNPSLESACHALVNGTSVMECTA